MTSPIVASKRPLKSDASALPPTRSRAAWSLRNGQSAPIPFGLLPSSSGLTPALRRTPLNSWPMRKTKTMSPTIRMTPRMIPTFRQPGMPSGRTVGGGGVPAPHIPPAGGGPAGVAGGGGAGVAGGGGAAAFAPQSGADGSGGGPDGPGWAAGGGAASGPQSGPAGGGGGDASGFAGGAFSGGAFSGAGSSPCGAPDPHIGPCPLDPLTTSLPTPPRSRSPIRPCSMVRAGCDRRPCGGGRMGLGALTLHAPDC